MLPDTLIPSTPPRGASPPPCGFPEAMRQCLPSATSTPTSSPGGGAASPAASDLSYASCSSATPLHPTAALLETPSCLFTTASETLLSSACSGAESAASTPAAAAAAAAGRCAFPASPSFSYGRIKGYDVEIAK